MMKCEELKDYDYDPDFPFQSRGRFYVADEVDAAIAELKAKLEDVQATAYAESVDAGMENRRLKRALFIAHAIKAKFKWWWLSECKHNESCKLFPDTRKIKKFTNSAWVCSKSQEKCRAKVEEYR